MKFNKKPPQNMKKTYFVEDIIRSSDLLFSALRYSHNLHR